MLTQILLGKEICESLIHICFVLRISLTGIPPARCRGQPANPGPCRLDTHLEKEPTFLPSNLPLLPPTGSWCGADGLLLPVLSHQVTLTCQPSGASDCPHSRPLSTQPWCALLHPNFSSISTTAPPWLSPITQEMCCHLENPNGEWWQPGTRYFLTLTL
jgi:hypothetical protein